MLLNHYYEGLVEAGCDEAGRGCLAGSVFAAAVILPANYDNPLLNDSKQLTEKRRYELRPIIERDALSWAVGIVTPEEIDRINILNASILAMHRALDQLTLRPQAIIVDGNRFKPYPQGGMPARDPQTEADSAAAGSPCAVADSTAAGSPCAVADSTAAGSPYLPYTCIVKGDAKYMAIAAASILAKTYRDDYMNQLAKEYPQYDWRSNKGYPTRKHREAIRQHGVTPYHRMTYNLLGSGELSLPFAD